MVSAAVGAELRDLLGELRQGIGGQQAVDPIGQGIVRFVVSGVEGVFAPRGPVGRNAQRLAHGRRSAFDHDLTAERGVDPARFRHVSLSHARPGRSAIADGVDQRPASRPLLDRIGRQVQLQQAHRALDVHADRAGIDVRRRDHHAADRRPVADVGVGVEHHVGHARRQPRMDGLPKRLVVERRADRLGADHGDRLDVAGRQHGRGFAGGNQSWLVLGCHAWPSISVSPLYHLPPMAGVVRENHMTTRFVKHLMCSAN